MKTPQLGTLDGESKTLGNGTAYSWVTLERKGNSLSIGIKFTESALKELSEGKTAEYMLTLPEEAASMAYNHIGINWSPQGHKSKEIYTQGICDKPHFDFHFYMILVFDL